jgi:hypothetical protein
MPVVEDLLPSGDGATPVTEKASKKKGKASSSNKKAPLVQRADETDDAFAARKKAQAERRAKRRAARAAASSKEASSKVASGADFLQAGSDLAASASGGGSHAHSQSSGGHCHGDSCCDEEPKERKEQGPVSWKGIFFMLLIFGMPLAIGAMGLLEYAGVIAPTPPSGPGARGGSGGGARHFDRAAALAQWRPVLRDFYSEHNPEKLPKVDAIITKYAPKRGGIPRLLAQLERKYEAARDAAENAWEERVGL